MQGSYVETPKRQWYHSWALYTQICVHTICIQIFSQTNQNLLWMNKIFMGMVEGFMQTTNLGDSHLCKVLQIHLY